MKRVLSSTFRSRLRGFLKQDAGVALVEFALALPIFILVFAVIVDGSRMMFSYQAAINGVRDATRYLSRAVPENICTTGGSVTGYSAELQVLVEQGLSGGSLFPPNVTITSVTPSYACFPTGYRGAPVAVAQVTAELSLTFPFQGVFDWLGSNLSAYTTSVTDQARVAGS